MQSRWSAAVETARVEAKGHASVAKVKTMRMECAKGLWDCATRTGKYHGRKAQIIHRPVVVQYCWVLFSC